MLESVDVSSGNGLEEKYKPTVTYNEETKLTEVSGTVKADAAEQTKFIFTNKLNPVVNIDLTKKWENVSGVTMPDSINIQLQRRVNDSDPWAAVEYATPGQTTANYITLKKDPYNPDKTEWTFSFTGLDRYANDTDGKVDKNKPYKYRIVEVTVADGSVKVIENNEYLNDLFKVTYTDAISVPSTEAGSSITKNYTITNTYSPLTNIKITKVDATDTTKRLNGVEFKLERLVPDSTSTGGESFKLDPKFAAITVTTGGTDSSVGTAQGIAEFKTKLKANNISSIEVTFKTKLNENAKIGKDGNLNDAQLDYSNAIYPTVDPTNPNNSKTPGEDHIKDQAIVYSFSIDVTKVDGNNNATKLSGVQFDLYRYTGNETNPTEEQLKQNAVAIKTNLTTGIDGKIAESGLNGLKNGRYFLVETKAASGYNLLKAPVEVNLNVDYVVKKTTDKWYDESNNLIGTKTTVTSTKFTGGDTNNAGTYSVTIENRKGFTLPKTGDIGTAMFLIIGIGGMLAAVYIMLRGRKRA